MSRFRTILSNIGSSDSYTSLTQPSHQFLKLVTLKRKPLDSEDVFDGEPVELPLVL